MTEEVRLNFLNWQPDKEEFGTEGLTEAQNVVHDTEGYKPVYLATDGAYSAGFSATITSAMSRNIGPINDLLDVWLYDDVLLVGLSKYTASAYTFSTKTSAGGTTTAFATTGSAQEIAYFDTAELHDTLAFVVEAQQTQTGSDSTINLSAIATDTNSFYTGWSFNNYSTPAGIPDGRCIGRVNEFILIGGGSSAPTTVQWCAIGDATDWPVPATDDARAKQAGKQVMNNKFGPVTAIASNDFFGYVFQKTGISKLQYVGGDVVFAFNTFEEGRGCKRPGLMVQVDDKIFFQSNYGFHMLENDIITDIGFGTVDDSF